MIAHRVERVIVTVLMFPFIVTSLQRGQELNIRARPIERPVLIKSNTRGLH
jgi:hypothetical protein